MLTEETRERAVQIVEPDRPPPCGAYVVPRFVRETLHVVRNVAAEFDDGLAEIGFHGEAGCGKALLDKRRELPGSKRDRRMTGPAL